MYLRKSLMMVLALLAGALLAQAKEYSPKFVCGVVKANSWTMDNNKEGIYEYDLAAGTLTKLTAERDVYQAPLGGAVYEDGKMKGIHFKTVWDDFDQTNTYLLYHVEYDMETWERTLAVTLGDMDRNYISSCGMAHDPITGSNYGIFYNFNMSWQVVNRKLATIDFSTNTPKRTILGNASIPMAAIACNDQGVLYGVGMDGWLYAISTANVGSGNEIEVTPLGDMGIDNISTNPSSMTYDKRMGRFYWSVVLNDQNCYLYEINPTIGQVTATQLTQTPDNSWLVNLYVPEPMAADDAPAAVTGLSATFEGASTTGTVSFTAPTTSYTDEPLTGTLNYVVTANGAEVATGTVEPGDAVTTDVSVPMGNVEIVVVVSNEAGTSPEAKLMVYVGAETPLAPTNVVFDYDYNTEQSIVTWTAPTMGINDQELDPEGLTYNIYRMPGDELVGEGVAETTFTQEFAPEVLAPYYYKIEAVHHTMVGAAAESNKAVVGPALDVPYTNNFNTSESFNLLTVLDNNHDGVTWKWERSYSGGGRATYYGSSEMSGDEWLLSPPLNLTKGATYSITFDANTAVSNCVDYMDVAYGQGLNTDGYTTLFDHIIMNEPLTQTYTNDTIVPAKSGVYYFGFHATSYLNYGWLLLHNFSIKKVSDAPLSLRGDVNADGVVDIADVNIVINIMLGKDSADNYDGRAYITDGDTDVDIADVNAVINLMLGKEQ
jgi:hypothetical protein